jgi:hypothetical protein
MKRLFLLFFIITSFISESFSQSKLLPDSIYSGKQGKMHVQGMALDSINGYLYLSFTNKLIKLDLSGKLIGSVTGFIGHLGDLDMSTDGKIYGSLEYKSDAIGKGIKKKLGISSEGEDGFYVAVFDGAKIVRPNMNAEKENLLFTVYIDEAVKDYQASITTKSGVLQHRFGCSGIDGIAFAPGIGEDSASKKFLYLAYGIYGDTTRMDNDHQIILKYDVSGWSKYAKGNDQENLHKSGPKKPLEKYFVKTGNTRYGIQNLAYDPSSGNLFAAVYHGSKSQFENSDLFVINGKLKPKNKRVQSGDQFYRVKTLALLQPEPEAEQQKPAGWFFKWGATGLHPLGNSLFYLSHDQKTKDGEQETTILKYKWVGKTSAPCIKVTSR